MEEKYDKYTLPKVNPATTRDQANAWWIQQAGGHFDLPDTFGNAIHFDNDFRSHVFYDNNGDHFAFIDNIGDIIAQPDDVWARREKGK